jgi:hypothetical protein
LPLLSLHYAVAGSAGCCQRQLCCCHEALADVAAMMPAYRAILLIAASISVFSRFAIAIFSYAISHFFATPYYAMPFFQADGHIDAAIDYYAFAFFAAFAVFGDASGRHTLFARYFRRLS